jgi:tetratricopeptide (TPR) repeat protein
VRAEIRGGQGFQVGQHNVQLNMWVQNNVPGAGEAGPVVAGEIPHEPAVFQRREDLLGVLRSGGPGVAVAAVTGMKGVGKTQLAAAFARECAAAGWRLVGWVDAQDPASVLAGLAVVAERLGIAPGAGAEDAAGAVRDWLAADGESCLLVFDNAADLGVVRRFLPAAGKSRVVVTTAGQVAGVRAAVVPVGVFSEGEGLGFLAERTGLADEAGARAVAEELGWLPLGLAQAGAVIAGQRLSYGVYLERLRQVSVGEYPAAELGDVHPRGVAEAVLLSLDAVAAGDAAGGMCRAVLDLVAVLSPAGVSRSLLYAAVGAGALAGYSGLQGGRLVDEAVGRLAEGSLLSFSGDGDSVTVHRLVMRVIRERAQRQGVLVPLGMRARGLLGSVTGSLERPWENRAAARDVIGQVIALHEHLRPCLDDSPELTSGLLSLRRRTLTWLIVLGDAADLAVEQGRSVIADCERVLGPDHPGTLECRDHLAAAFLMGGRPGEAIPLLEATLADYRRVLAHDHPDALKCRNHLAAAHQMGGRPGEAILLYEAILADCERVLGHDHLDTLKCRHNLAAAYHAAGRPGEAIPLWEAILADCERVLGHDHPHTLVSRQSLAMGYRTAGRLDEAIPLYEATLADHERVLGPDHPYTLRCRTNLAAAYQAAGRPGEAIPLYEATLADHERVLGHAHPDTLRCRHNLAVGYREAGRPGEAIPLYEATLADQERVLGPDHPDTLGCRHSLAFGYREAGRLGEAIPLWEATLADYRRVLGHDHPDTLRSRNSLALGYREAGRLGEAIPLLEATLADYRRVLGHDHPDTLRCRYNLALGCQAAGRLGEAIRLYEAILADRERVLGHDHSDTLASRNSLAAAYQTAGRSSRKWENRRKKRQ